MIKQKNLSLHKYILLLIFPTVFLVQVGRMFGYNLNMFIHAPILILFILFSIEMVVMRSSKYYSNCILNNNRWFTLYLCYVLISIIWYSNNYLPLDLYFDNLKLFVLPMLFYFWGVNHKLKGDSFYNVFFASITICVLIGIYLYITTPSYYVSYMLECRQNSTMGSIWQNENNIMDHNRFSSFFESSYAISYMGTSALCIAFSYILNKRSKFPNYLLFSAVIINITGVLLCMQRIAWAMNFIYMVVFLLSGFKNGKKQVVKMALTAILVVIFLMNIAYIVDDRISVIIENLIERNEVMNFGIAMSTRTNQYADIDLFSLDKLLGSGLGSGGRLASINFHANAVADGEYIKQIVEFGWVGFALFIFLIVSSLKKVFAYRDYFILEIFIVVYFVAAGIGHNSLNSYFYDYIFWFALGRMNNSEYIKSVVLKPSITK